MSIKVDSLPSLAPMNYVDVCKEFLGSYSLKINAFTCCEKSDFHALLCSLTYQRSISIYYEIISENNL